MVIFHIGENNIRSQKATERIGAVRDGFVEKLDRNGRPISQFEVSAQETTSEGLEPIS